jgi:hypothetical protein
MADENTVEAASNPTPVSAMGLLQKRQARLMEDDSGKGPREEYMSYDLGRYVIYLFQWSCSYGTLSYSSTFNQNGSILFLSNR